MRKSQGKLENILKRIKMKTQYRKTCWTLQNQCFEKNLYH